MSDLLRIYYTEKEPVCYASMCRALAEADFRVVGHI